jgi:hypothetical protein
MNFFLTRVCPHFGFEIALAASLALEKPTILSLEIFLCKQGGHRNKPLTNFNKIKDCVQEIIIAFKLVLVCVQA